MDQGGVQNRGHHGQPAQPAHNDNAQKGRAVIAQAAAQKETRQAPERPGHDGQTYPEPENPGGNRKEQTPAQQRQRCEQNFVAQQGPYSGMVNAASP